MDWDYSVDSGGACITEVSLPNAHFYEALLTLIREKAFLFDKKEDTHRFVLWVFLSLVLLLWRSGISGVVSNNYFFRKREFGKNSVLILHLGNLI